MDLWVEPRREVKPAPHFEMYWLAISATFGELSDRSTMPAYVIYSDIIVKRFQSFQT
jgi:hypothetical protein